MGVLGRERRVLCEEREEFYGFMAFEMKERKEFLWFFGTLESV